jgi:S-adenosylmethionine/arginine decarboxylase-like enzyme
MTKGIDSMAQPIGLHTRYNDMETGLPIVSGIYGKEIAFDCHMCNAKKFNRRSLRQYFKGLVKLLNMKAGPLHFWDDVGVPKKDRQTKIETKGTTAVQFIYTSNITVHCLDLLERVYVNIFSCKDFDEGDARYYTQNFFEAKIVGQHRFYRN